MKENATLDDFELIVHIGTGKTGSSSIQKTLSANAQGLKTQGVAYLGLMCEEAPVKRYGWQVPGGWPRLMAIGKENAEQQLREVITDAITELREQGIRRAIWSNETIFDNGELIIPLLERLATEGVRVCVIVYIRRHDAWARSAFFQWGLKHKVYQGPVKSFGDWYKSRRINFSRKLEAWIEHKWADIAVRNFDTCGDVVTDFIQYYSLQNPDMATRRENETPNAVALALWAMYNSQFDTPIPPTKLQMLLKKAGLLERTPVDCDFMSLLPSQENIDFVKLDCARDRERINAIFSRFSQPQMDVSPLKSRDMGVTQNQINAALLLMIWQQAQEIEQLKRELQDPKQVDSGHSA